jgi:two-component system, chemotaxis family, sensor kinase CheA
MSDQFDMSELLDVFFEEADEQLQHLDEGILALEKNPEDIGLVREIFRSAHTLKGSSATMGFTQIADLTHTMESLLDRIRSGQQQVSQSAVDALLKAVDALRQLVEQVRGGCTDEAELDDVLQALKAANESDSESSQPARTAATADTRPIPDGSVRIEAVIARDCVMASVRGFMVLNALRDLGEVVDSSPEQDKLEELQPGGTLLLHFKPSASIEKLKAELNCISEIEVTVTDAASQPKAEGDAASKATSAPATPQKTVCEPTTHAMQTVRVGVDRLDILMNLVGELVIDRTRIGQIESMLSARYEGEALCGGLSESALHIGRVINELQEQIMRIRMLPVDQVFNRFPRMVRDLGQKAGKKVNFVISGQDTELDRSILEDIVDPITHLLRNAVDHGLESPEERAAAGKPETCTVQLVARQEENRIVIEVEDDGKGIAVQSVKRSAVAKGAISAEAAERLSEREALQLIFPSGVSTAEKVTDVSGRGVGMDVVKSNIERLSGAVEVHTEVGIGTRISLHLPLTLAIVQALITRVENRVFAIPLTSVVETNHCRKSEISTIEGRPVLQFRGSVLPLVRMDTIFPSKYSGESKSRSDKTVLVIVRTSGQLIGVAVDALVGEQEVVIKSLGSYFGQVQGISGAALMGDGGIALIVDVAGLPAIVERERVLVAA